MLLYTECAGLATMDWCCLLHYTCVAHPAVHMQLWNDPQVVAACKHVTSALWCP